MLGLKQRANLFDFIRRVGMYKLMNASIVSLNSSQ